MRKFKFILLFFRILSAGFTICLGRPASKEFRWFTKDAVSSWCFWSRLIDNQEFIIFLVNLQDFIFSVFQEYNVIDKQGSLRLLKELVLYLVGLDYINGNLVREERIIQNVVAILNLIYLTFLAFIFFIMGLFGIGIYDVNFTILRDKCLEIHLFIHLGLYFVFFNIFHSVFLASVMCAKYFHFFFIE